MELHLFRPIAPLFNPSIIAPPTTGKISVNLQFMVLPYLQIPRSERDDFYKLIKNCCDEVCDTKISSIRCRENGLLATYVETAFYINSIDDITQQKQAIDNQSRIIIEKLLGVVSFCAGIKFSAKNVVPTITSDSCKSSLILNMEEKIESPKIGFSIPKVLYDEKVSDEIFTALFWLRRGLAEGDPIDTFSAFTVCLQILARDWWKKKIASSGVIEKQRPQKCPRCKNDLPQLETCPHCNKDLPISKIPPSSYLFKEYITTVLGADPDLVKVVWEKNRNAIVAHGNKINIDADDFIGLTELKMSAAEWAYHGINLALGLELENAPKPSRNFFVTDALMNLD